MQITEIATGILSGLTPTFRTSEPIGLLLWGGTLIALSLSLRFASARYSKRSTSHVVTAKHLEGITPTLTQPVRG